MTLMPAASNVDEVLADLAWLASKVVTPPAACSITLRHDQRPHTVAMSDPLAARVDEMQYRQGVGPGLQTLRTGEPVAVPELAAERRWGAYRPRALRYGVRSSLSFPLLVGGETRGVLSLYALVSHAFGEAARRQAERFAAQASAALAPSDGMRSAIPPARPGEVELVGTSAHRIGR